jgi:hypothetical protein
MAGLEPAYFRVSDFKSDAFANFATQPIGLNYLGLIDHIHHSGDTAPMRIVGLINLECQLRRHG